MNPNRDAGVIHLSVEDQQRLVEALIDPPPLAPALTRAIKRRGSLFGVPGGRVPRHIEDLDDATVAAIAAAEVPAEFDYFDKVIEG